MVNEWLTRPSLEGPRRRQTSGFALKGALHAECAEWMHNRQVSVYGGDCIEKLPYPSESFTSAIHMIVLASMGLPILDWPSLTELARTCERLKRWDFLLTTAPLRLPGGTSSPINPLCLF